MKRRCNVSRSWCRVLLYIPLRSDETVGVKREVREQWTLYPTTFRWNSVAWSSGRPSCFLYIPLRSDETLQPIHGSWPHTALYIPLRSDETPLCFSRSWPRWTLYIPLRSDETSRSLPLSCRRWCLYIPLRSDETGWPHVDRGEKTTFISHYVQMKPAMGGASLLTYFALYPTTFRWNSAPENSVVMIG